MKEDGCYGICRYNGNVVIIFRDCWHEAQYNHPILQW